MVHIPLRWLKLKFLGLKAPRSGFGKRGEEIAERGEQIDVGADVGAVGLSDGILVEDEELVEMVHPAKRSAEVGHFFGSFCAAPFAAEGSFCGGLDEIA